MTTLAGGEDRRERSISWSAFLREPRWVGFSAVLSLLMCVPLIALVVIAFSAKDNIWPHLLSTVLPGSVLTTLLLMLGVGLTTTIIGTGMAWLVTMYRFPGKHFYAWLLLVPLAMPTYLSAFSYLELWDYSGWVQTTLRTSFGWQSARDYWFPDIRSLGGAIFVMSVVLYPYVYLTARASFIQQSVSLLEAARLLGRTPFGVFTSVGLPLARPAIIAGVTLALMECLNDIGAVEYFGVNTLTVSVYSTWLERGSLSGAAQIACVMLVFVFALLWMERTSRRRQLYHRTKDQFRDVPTLKLKGWRGWCACAVCAVPMVLGFVMPAIIMLDAALLYWEKVFESAFWAALGNSVTLASIAALFAVSIGLVLAFANRITGNPLVRAATRIASIGYAVPGTILAIGVLIPLAGLDNAIDGVMRSVFGISSGLLLSGTMAALIFTYVVRFLAISHGAIEAGYGKLSPNLDYASRTLGRSAFSTLLEVHLPLMRPALGAAALLVFVDVMKELPATLLLRPFNFDTLATHVYTLASLDLFEESAPAALMIVAAGLLPVILLNRVISLPNPGERPLAG
ncbi:MAG: ABC transporter permease [Hyphomicrobiales bacterium]